MQLPSAHDINPIPENLDGQYAEQHFLGKTVSDALRLFEANFLASLEDLSHMGPRAFAYYVPAAIAYAESDAVKHDCEVAHALLTSMIHWHDVEERVEQRELFREYSERLLKRIDRMELVFAPDYRLERQVRRFLERLRMK